MTDLIGGPITELHKAQEGAERLSSELQKASAALTSERREKEKLLGGVEALTHYAMFAADDEDGIPVEARMVEQPGGEWVRASDLAVLLLGSTQPSVPQPLRLELRGTAS